MTSAHDSQSLYAAVHAYICNNFLVRDAAALTADTSLLDAGIVDSTGYLEVFQWLKDEYGVDVHETEMGPDNFETVGLIAAFLQRKLGAS